MTIRLCTAVAAVLFGAAPAHADDIFEIDRRLVDAGFDEAYAER